MLMYLYVAGGFLLLLAGGEFLVRGAVTLARRLGVSPLVIGLTIVAFGTSAPELVVSVNAALENHPDIVLGNVVGSNIANILLIVGAAAAIKAIQTAPGIMRRDGLTLLFATGLFIALCFLGEIDRPLGLAMVVALVGYGIWSFVQARRSPPEDVDDTLEAVDTLSEKQASSGIATIHTIGGIIGVVVGADLLIDGAVDIARAAGLSEAVIGLTLVAFGTSLPELATSVIAAFRGHGDLSIGNVVGSNLFNMLGITGAVAAIVTIGVPPEIMAFDIWVMFGVTVALLIMMWISGRVGRGIGVLMLVAYIAYIGLLVTDTAPSLAIAG